MHGGEVKADLPLSSLSGRAPEYDRPWEETPPAETICGRAADRPDRRAEEPHRQRELLRPLLGLRAIRHDGDGRHGRGPRLGRGRDPRARHRQEARLHRRRHPALRQGEPRARRHAGGGRGLPQPLRGRRETPRQHRQPQLRQPREAADHGPVRRRDQRHRRRLRGARHADRLGQRVALQRDRRRRDPADAHHRRGRPHRRGRGADPRTAPARATSPCSSARPDRISAARRS